MTSEGDRLRYAFGLVVLIVAAFGAYWLISALRQLDTPDGVPLVVEFRDARGLKAGADVRYRGVRVGIVRSVMVSGDGNKAQVLLLLDAAGMQHARVSSSFWIATPRLHGLTGGASGLDTLVRDAYVAFVTPQAEASRLAAGSTLLGREVPQDLAADLLPELAQGDLLMTLLAPENHGLSVGAAVVFRGIATGELRSIALSADGQCVELLLRVGAAHRHTVTNQAQFWVGRPVVSGALLSGFSVTDVGALLAPYIGYHAQPGHGVPVTDGHRAAALAERPELAMSEVPAQALTQPSPTIDSAASVSQSLSLARVSYQAVDRDLLSADDAIAASGTGLFYCDATGRALVATARSLVDGSYAESESWGGDPEIEREQIVVRLADGSVRRANRIWVEPNGADLAVLRVEAPPHALRGTAAAHWLLAGEPTEPVQRRVMTADGKVVEFAHEEGAVQTEHLGAVLGSAAQARAIYGRADARSKLGARVPLRLLPADLLPR